MESLPEGIEEGVAHVSKEGAILYANPQFAELFGLRSGGIVERRSMLRDFLAPDCWDALETTLAQGAQRATEGSLQVDDPAQSGVRTVRLALSPVRWKKATTIKITARETTELVEENPELQDKEMPLHAVSARILQLQDEEWRRIARDLHDITGQELPVVIMQMMETMKYQRSQTMKEKITDAAGLVRKIEDEIRTLSYVLHPPLLDEFGLGAALNRYAEGFTKRSGIQVDVECTRDPRRLKAEKEMALFRVVQDGLTNVMRHSGSEKARIGVDFDTEYVVLSVTHEGQGTNRSKIARMTTAMQSGVGITGMRERLQRFDGRLEILPREKGTEFRATVPVEHRAPIETPPSKEDILRMAEALGYQREPAQAAQKRVRICDDPK
jgi:two-component system, NarL family, sensor kinase